MEPTENPVYYHLSEDGRMKSTMPRMWLRILDQHGRQLVIPAESLLTEDWICLSASGRNGVDGKSPRVLSTWSSTDKYYELDIVALNGASFMARKDSPGQCPGEDWQLVASQGKQGKPGDRGLPGPKGERGLTGLPGPMVKSVSIDNEGLLTLANADGTVVSCGLYPLLVNFKTRGE